MANFKQINAFVAVYEAGSFTAAAQREHATQSGISQHIAALEADLGQKLVVRGRDGVVPTGAGKRYYRHCVAALHSLNAGQHELQLLDGRMSGTLRAGLMPAFTRVALAPALHRFANQFPEVDVQVTEAYSGALTDMVRSDLLDFAIVPAAKRQAGLKTTLLSRDVEMLVTSTAYAAKHGLKPLEPVRLSDLQALKLVVPGASNVRRSNLQQYLDTNGVGLSRVIEMDAMLGTLEFVARGDWVTILPGVLLGHDRDGQSRVVCPLAEPALHAEFVVLEPARRPMQKPAQLFLDELRAEITAINASWPSGND